MSSEDNKAIVRHWYEEAINQRNPAALDKFIASDAIDHSAPAGMTSGTEGSKQTMNMFLAAFPDMQVTIEDMIAEGDKVVVRHTFRGTHTSNFLNMPPTGKQVTVEGINIIRMVGGKQVEIWNHTDIYSFLQQLGADTSQPVTEPLGRRESEGLENQAPISAPIEGVS